MMLNITLTPAHGYVMAAVGCTFLVHHLYMAGGVMKARKAFGVKYPTLYLDSSDKNAKAYNCVQRAHQNSLENLSSFYALLFVAGIRFPIAAAASAAIYNLGRIMYFRGYCTGEPSGRTVGGFLHLGQLALLGMVGRFAYEAFTASATA